MPLPSTEAQQDAFERRDGRVVELACDTCPESWTVTVPDGSDLTYRQTICPVRGCSGEGEEV
jgi:hypothetical protein